MHVVLIAYHFPPDPAVGSLRAAKVARAFAGAGHRVDVVTARHPEDHGVRSSDIPGVTIHSVKPLPSPRDLSARIANCLSILRRRHSAADGRGQTTWTPPTHVAAWQRVLSSLLWLPDDRQGFIVPAWRMARRLVRSRSDLVYSTAPPYSPHLAGLLLKWTAGIRWVMELRDPWADNDQKPWWVRSHPTDAIDARLERLCVTRADLVVTVSEGIRRRVLERRPALGGSQVLVVRNGIGELSAIRSCPAQRERPVRIAYTGTFYYGRDPRSFLRGLAAICHKQRMGPEQIRVDFVGACRAVGPVSVEKEIQALGLTGLVHIHDWLPHAEAQAILEQAGVLLLLAQQQPDQIPNKLYEYLGCRRPILAFADANGETARMLQQVGGHYVVTGNDDAEVERALAAALASGGRGEVSGTDEVLLKEWTTDVQMQHLLAAVETHE